MMRQVYVAVAVFLLASGVVADARAGGDAARGKTLFGRCSACHAVTADNKVGPGLSGVFGRTAGTVPGARYSKAMAGSGTVWSEESLDAFLAAPSKALPGTTMGIGLPNAKDRADVIAYLKTLAAP